MLGKNYIEVNYQKIPNPKSLSISYTNTETVKQSEAATDIVIITRLLKRTLSFSFDSSSRGRDLIKTFCAMAQVTLTLNGEDMTGRLRMTGEKLVENSECTDRTDGLWSLSVTFTED